MSNSVFNDDNILTRVDGRRTRSIPIEKKSSESSAQNEPATPASTLPDSFPTHVHCRWCDSIIKDVYIPQFKNGRNGKPFDVVVGYEPCQNCRNKWNTMVIFIEVTNIEPYPDCLPIDEDIREITDGYIDPVEEPEKYKKRATRATISARALPFSMKRYTSTLPEDIQVLLSKLFASISRVIQALSTTVLLFIWKQRCSKKRSKTISSKPLFSQVVHC